MLVSDFAMPTQAVTVSFLIRGEDDGFSSFLGYGVVDSFNEFILSSDDGDFSVVVKGDTQDLSNSDILDGTIHHVATTWTQAREFLEVFIDGELAFATQK